MWSNLRAAAVGLIAAAAGVLAALPGARAEVPEGIWVIPNKVGVRVFDCSGSLCGQVVWLRNEALRTPALCQRVIIWGLRPSGANRWSNGWFLDPENGRTYDLSAALRAPDTMTARVYLGAAFMGRTETLHRTTLGSLPGSC